MFNTGDDFVGPGFPAMDTTELTRTVTIHVPTYPGRTSAPTIILSSKTSGYSSNIEAKVEGEIADEAEYNTIIDLIKNFT